MSCNAHKMHYHAPIMMPVVHSSYLKSQCPSHGLPVRRPLSLSTVNHVSGPLAHIAHNVQILRHDYDPDPDSEPEARRPAAGAAAPPSTCSVQVHRPSHATAFMSTAAGTHCLQPPSRLRRRRRRGEDAALLLRRCRLALLAVRWRVEMGALARVGSAGGETAPTDSTDSVTPSALLSSSSLLSRGVCDPSCLRGSID
jgi:hypothetical protein